MRLHRSAAALALVTGFALLGTACNNDPVADGGDSPSGGAQTPSKKPEPTADRKLDADAGKTLELGGTTALTYKRGSNSAITMEVTAKSVRKGAQSDLDKVRLDAEERSLQPYYVSFDFKNIGKSSLEYPSLTIPSRLRDSRGEEGKTAITVRDDVKACPANDVNTFAPGDSISQCAVFLLPKGEEPSVVLYRGDYDKEPVFWKAAG
ncbi:hypothetical protein [Streptomyces palmae]|uniref:DUF4352 domain-containing protein n=1 Tax=Streptomyces palmae TaxID=1701085 RepID=A0A4Z0GIH7_9ACTN|nr:hypothetical protein [Streptomyces palmae]TGA96371.1 hypothetical protein E4099_24170 [Streptomyces palmae]